MLDERGYLYLKGRAKDMIIRGGVNIYPAEVEAVLQSHPAVADSAVVGWPSREFNEEVAAFVILKGTATPVELRELCRSRMAPVQGAARGVRRAGISRATPSARSSRPSSARASRRLADRSIRHKGSQMLSRLPFAVLLLGAAFAMPAGASSLSDQADPRDQPLGAGRAGGGAGAHR